ncbi:MAG: metallophosphoesterase [Bacteroidota bacterium]
MNYFKLFLFCLLPLTAFSQYSPVPIDNGYKGGHIKGITKTPNSLDFILFGDWGRNGEYFQKDVAKQMSRAIYDLGAEFLVVTGDNFYPDGVASTRDSHWEHSLESVYTTQALQHNWYVVLGNHDYHGNPNAEIEYTKVSRRWNMPARYYSKRINLNGDSTQQLLMLFMDTSPFIKDYYTGSGAVADSLRRQDTTAQKTWLIRLLSDPNPNIKWKIVVGHHPLYSGSKRLDATSTFDMRNSFKDIFEKYKVDFYLCGHEHNLQALKTVGHTRYFISGAGSEAENGYFKPENNLFGAAQGGFMTFSIQPKQALVQVINYKGKILYKETIKK